MQIILASRNLGKVKEIQHIADKKIFGKVQFLPLPDKVPEIPEPFTTYVENALHKAREVSKYTNLPVMAEDSGINVPILNGAPGIYSARYASLDNKNSNDNANNQKLLAELNKINATGSARKAYYFCACVIIQHPQDQNPLITQGLWTGEIAMMPSGTGGFGYDPLFYIKGLGKTSAELDFEEKCLLSHRTKALNKMFAEIQSMGLI